jgi:parallel beta-helix repeat protein
MKRLLGGLLAVVWLASVLAPGATAQQLACGAEVTSDVTLEASLIGCSTGLVIGADGITVDLNGYAIEGVGAVASSGIQAIGRANVTVRNGSVRGFDAGVRLEGTSGFTVESLTISGNGTGIHCRNSGATRIEHNNAVGNGSGVLLDFCSATTLVHNVASRNAASGIIRHRSDGTLEKNSANGNGQFGVWSIDSHGELVNNVTNANGAHGLFVTDLFPDHGRFHTITGHVANANGGHGIFTDLVGVIDGGKNRAHANRGGAQCLGVECR